MLTIRSSVISKSQPFTIWVLAIFLVTFLVQTIFWQHIPFIDQDLWVYRIDSLIEDLTVNNFQFQTQAGMYARYSGHPGTSITSVAALLRLIGASSIQSLALSITLLNSLIITLIIVTCRRLSPTTYWWLPAGIMVTLHSLYYYSTPTNALIAPLLTLITLLVAKVHQLKKINTASLILISILIGLGLATRTSITIFLTLPLLISIKPIIHKKRLGKVLLIAVITALVLIPPLWFTPVSYAKAIILMPLTFLTTANKTVTRISLSEFIQYAPLSIISLLLTISLLWQKSYRPPVPLIFLLTYILITAGASIVFILARFQSIRYFFPLIMFWDILLPLLLLDASRRFNFNFLRYDQQHLARTIFSSTTITIVISAHLFLSYHLIFSPLPRGVI